MTTQRPYRAAIIGCGKIAGFAPDLSPEAARLTHAGALDAERRIETVACADPDTERAAGLASQWGIGAVYGDYREMLERERPDFVSLCLSTEGHSAAVAAAAAAGVRALLCEKPLAYDPIEAKAMAEAARGVAAAVNYHRRYNATLAELRDRLRGGTWGRPVHIVCRYTKGVFVNGSHFIDLVLWFLGPPSRVELLARHGDDTRDPGLDFRLHWDAGTTATFLHVAGLPWACLDVDLACERGRIRIGHRGQRLTIEDVVADPDYPALGQLRVVEDTETDWRNTFGRAVGELVDGLDSGAPSLTSPFDESVQVVDICRRLVDEALTGTV